jgi:hypothetical protein
MIHNFIPIPIFSQKLSRRVVFFELQTWKNIFIVNFQKRKIRWIFVAMEVMKAQMFFAIWDGRWSLMNEITRENIYEWRLENFWKKQEALKVKSKAKKLDNLDEKYNVHRKKWRMKNPSTMIRINSEIIEKVIIHTANDRIFHLMRNTIV